MASIFPSIPRIICTIFTAIILFYSTAAYCQNINIEELSRDPQWLALLHAEDGRHSKIAGEKFFLSQNGQSDPNAELITTVEELQKKDSQVQCQFPARYEWLKTKLPEIAALEKTACPELALWYSAINPSGITLIFASSFVNNPASAFGHTFLRLDQKDSQDLLAYSANYAAATGGEDALSYAAKGIFGGYAGYYSVTPYYVKVKEYSDMENRDIWEYRLTYSEEQIRRLVLHLWELRDAAVPYYYFDENCSYKILELLNVAKPELLPQNSFRSWVIPVDTVRFIKSDIAGIKFRASARSLLEDRLAVSSPEQKNQALKIADPSVQYDLKNADSQSMDLAYELISYKRIAKELNYSEELINKRSFEILLARGEQQALPIKIESKTPESRPDIGHNSSQIGVEVGRKRDLWFSRFSLRPAFHDLTDPQAGYVRGSEIKFFDFALDATESEKLDLAYLTALDITSLSSRNDFFSPLSWNIRTGLKRNMIDYRDDSLSTYAGASAGYSWDLNTENLFYSMLDSEIRANKHYQSDLNPGAGIRLGFLSNINSKITATPELKWLRFVDQTALESRVNLGYAVSQNMNLVANLNYQREYDRNAFISSIGVEWFITPR